MARILVVEDNPDNMKLFRALLTMKGHEVTGLLSGENLLDTIQQTRPALVLMDIQLPGRDGFALLKEVRASAWAGTPIVALTAHAMSGDQEKARAAGFDDYITKPIDIATFGDQIVRALQGPRSPNRERG
jgi:CheY-like chemotaxis protein